MSKLGTVKTIFEIGKSAAEIYDTFTSGRKREHEMSKELEDLRKENEDLKAKLARKSKTDKDA